MFEGFKKTSDGETRRRFALSAFASVALYGGLAAAMVVAAGRTPPEEKKEKPLDVVFRAPEPPKTEAPPPPPPPAVPPSLRVKKVATATLPTLAPLVEPLKLSDKKLAEKDPSKDEVVVGDGASHGERGGRGSAKAEVVTPAPVAVAKPQPKKPEAVNLPEDAEPPEPSDDNVMPEYPEEMRTQGIEAQVIFKVVITEDGAVKDIQVLKGDEPFLGVARDAVKKWRFTPAKLDGNAIAVFKIIKIPFRLKG